MSNTCPNCSAAVDADAVFCMACGNSIAQTVHCPKCVGIIPAEAKFCKYCALDLNKWQEKVQSQPLSESPPSTITLPTQQAKTAPDNPASFISPAGAAFAMICFFLPWLKVSQCGITKTVSGTEIANLDSSFWLFPLMGIASVTAYFVAKGQRRLWKARPYIVTFSGFALMFLFYKYFSIPSGPEIMGKRITAADLGITLEFGGYGIVIGFILAIIGCVFMSRRSISSFDSVQTEKPVVLIGIVIVVGIAFGGYGTNTLFN